MTITEQPRITQSELNIFDEGFAAHEAGHCITTNPYPAVCQQSLRDHWVWDQGWRIAATPH